MSLSSSGFPLTASQINAMLASYGITVPDNKLTITGSGDTTKHLLFEVDSMAVTGKVLTVDVGAQTLNRILSVPVLTANRTLAVIDQAQTFTAAQTFAAISATGITDTGLTTGRLTFATTGGLLTDDAGTFYDPTNDELFVGDQANFGRFKSSVGKFQARGEGQTTECRIQTMGTGFQGYLAFDRARGTFASPTAINGDTLGSVVGAGCDGTATLKHGPEVALVANELWGASALGCRVDISAIVNGATAQTVMLQIGAGTTGTVRTSRVFEAQNATAGGVGTGSIVCSGGISATGGGYFGADSYFSTSSVFGVTSLDADVASGFGGVPKIVAVTNTDTTAQQMFFLGNGNGPSGAHIFAAKTRSTGTDANTIVQSGDECFLMAGLGSNGTTYSQAGSYAIEVDGTPGAASMPGRLVFRTTPSGTTTTAERARIDNKGNVIVGTAALAANATDGFLFIPTCAGAPSGVPTAQTGRIAMIYDSTNNFFYFYNGGWKKSTVYA